MERIFRIEDSNPFSKSVIEFLQSLDFAKEDKIEQEQFVVTEEHLKILNERRLNRIEGKSKTHSWEEVKEFARTRNAK